MKLVVLSDNRLSNTTKTCGMALTILFWVIASTYATLAHRRALPLSHTVRIWQRMPLLLTSTGTLETLRLVLRALPSPQTTASVTALWALDAGTATRMHNCAPFSMTCALWQPLRRTLTSRHSRETSSRHTSRSSGSRSTNSLSPRSAEVLRLTLRLASSTSTTPSRRLTP